MNNYLINHVIYSKNIGKKSANITSLFKFTKKN